MATVLCYQMFTHGFIVAKYFPLFMVTMKLARELSVKELYKSVMESDEPESFKRQITEMGLIKVNHLYHLHETNREEYDSIIQKPSEATMFLFPIAIVQYFRFIRLVKKLRKYLNQE